MKIYNVFTISELNQQLLFDTFNTYEDAEKFVNGNTEANIRLVKDAILYEKFGCKQNDLTNWKPVLVNRLFPFNNVMYGTTIRETKQIGSRNIGEFNYTYRFIIESEIK